MTEKSYDVLVIGLGGVGSAACRSLAAAGHRVLGVERFGRVHDLGASHGESRGVWQAYFMGPGYVPFLRRAYALWSDLEEESGEHLFHRTGGLCLGPSDGELVPAARASAEQTGLTHEVLSADEVHARYPQFTPDSDDVAVFDPDSGFVQPEQTVRVQLELAEKHGATLHFHERVLSVTEDARGAVVRTDRDTYHVGHVVVGAGCWAPELLPESVLPVQVLRKVMLWFEPEGTADDFLPGRFPYWIWEGDGMIGYGHPGANGLHGGVKAGVHSGGTPTDPDLVDRYVEQREVAEIQDFLRTRIPRLGAGRYRRSAVCLYDNTPDQAFVIGPTSEHGRIVAAAGTSGHAFKFLPAIGEAVGQLVTDGRASQDLSLFDPRRFRDAQAAPAAG
ncbi:N-methyl-L-tryptophan oxidase [Streptomyces sp. SP18CS02]|uniref:N-methyl-L-tryptophan oxidase n=1 Tax=Streptomyces sp. SP18CS02 TaxID=3002531 RepID=UPI002E7A4612|nr:N-methyl-L-tryptophan oxidase [Streptomyces sp. SP18CS02]MEE1753792.1 N-methyl-L-tryptophan oxidase [Streptomyces sp. SP18CS02]